MAKTISRRRVAEAAAALGLNPDRVASLNITPERVRVIEYQTDGNGQRIWNPVLGTHDKRAYTLEVK